MLSIKTLLQPPWARRSDEEYIRMLRRSLAWWDRYRRWLLVLYVMMTAAMVWLFVSFVQLLLGIFQPPNAPFALAGFVIGILLGLGFSGAIFNLANGLFSTLFGFRDKRLLLKYHDALRTIISVDDDPRDSVPVNRESEEQDRPEETR